MSSFRKFEKILLLAGALLALSSLWMILFRSDQFMAWLGYSSGTKLQVAGVVEKHEKMIRRRLYNSNEFLPVEDKQTLFSRDTVMTGTDSGMVIVLNDGSLIELGPDTLIEIRLKDEAAGMGSSEFMIHLQKGNVSGKSANQNISVSRGGEISALGQLSANGIAAKLLAEPYVSKIAPRPCVIGKLYANSPFENTNREVRISGEVNCESNRLDFAVELLNGQGEKLTEKRLDVEAGSPTRFELPVPGPGNYSVGKEAFAVAKDYVGIAWKPNPLRCDRLLDFEVSSKAVTQKDKLMVLEEGRTELLPEADWKKQTKLPVKIQMVFETENHYRLISNQVAINTWRDCPTLKHPPLASIFARNNGALLFTWIQTDGTTYRFELSTDPLFKTHLKNESTSHNFSSYNANQKGIYYWRVQSRKTGDLSDIFQFEVR